MKKFQVSKYDPAFRAVDGKYLKDEWTSVSDIGKIFNGKLFSAEEYLKAEANYVRLMKLILDETESSYLRLVGLNKYDDFLIKSENIPYEKKSEEIYSALKEGQVLDINDALIVSRLILRENVWCYLVNKYVTFEFGYDYYLYITLEKEPKIFKNVENKLDLFVQEIGNITNISD